MKHIILAAAVAFTGACGGGDEPVQRGTVNPTGAQSSVENVSRVFAALDTANGETAADAVLALTAAGQILVTPTTARELPARAYLPRAWPASKTRTSLTGSATCDASGCTYVDYGDSSEYGTYRINGTIRRTGDTLAFDLTYDITADGLEFHWQLDGNVRVTPALIDGEVHSSGDARFVADGESYEIGWDIDIVYDAIVLDAGGCPVGGGLSATVGYEVSGAQSGSYRAAGSVRFGPACGQFQAN